MAQVHRVQSGEPSHYRTVLKSSKRPRLIIDAIDEPLLIERRDCHAKKNIDCEEHEGDEGHEENKKEMAYFASPFLLRALRVSAADSSAVKHNRAASKLRITKKTKGFFAFFASSFALLRALRVSPPHFT